jgi:hypothetical protein
MIWSLVFLAIYLLLLRYQTTSEYLIAFWDGLLSFMPMPPWRDLSWFPKAIGGLLFIGGLSSGLILSAALYTLGLWAYFSEEKWLWIITLTIPFALNLGVSGFKKFPFHGRLILYLLPLLFITLGKGIDEIVKIIKNRTLANVIFAGLMVLLLHPAIPTATDFLFTQKYLTDDLKPVLAYMQENARSDDLIYLYHHASQKFIYYAPDYNLEKLSRIDGDDRSRNAAKYQHDLSLLPRGQRIWFVFSSVSDTKVENTKQDERTYILEYLNEHGTILKDYFATNDASSAHLYMLDK